MERVANKQVEAEEEAKGGEKTWRCKRRKGRSGRHLEKMKTEKTRKQRSKLDMETEKKKWKKSTYEDGEDRELEMSTRDEVDAYEDLAQLTPTTQYKAKKNIWQKHLRKKTVIGKKHNQSKIHIWKEDVDKNTDQKKLWKKRKIRKQDDDADMVNQKTTSTVKTVKGRRTRKKRMGEKEQVNYVAEHVDREGPAELEQAKSKIKHKDTNYEDEDETPTENTEKNQDLKKRDVVEDGGSERTRRRSRQRTRKRHRRRHRGRLRRNDHIGRVRTNTRRVRSWEAHDRAEEAPTKKTRRRRT